MKISRGRRSAFAIGCCSSVAASAGHLAHVSQGGGVGGAGEHHAGGAEVGVALGQTAQ